jgi:hypothetical protein
VGTATKRLRKARRIRTHNAHALRLLENGHISIVSILEEPPDRFKRIPIYDLMRRAPGLGVEGSRRILTKTAIWPYDRLGQVPLEKRRQIVALLPDRARKS